MPGSFGLNENDRNELGKQFVDVGIAEEQAVAMAAGMAKRRCKTISYNKCNVYAKML